LPDRKIEEFADEIWNDVERAGIAEHQSIYLVAYSLGGIVTRSLVTRNWNQLKGKLKSVLFVASPLNGGDMEQ